MEEGFFSGEKTKSRILPPGKDYHVFLSYRDIDDDKKWVRVLAEKLKTEYNMICCDHSVDFQPGRKIVENIKHAVTSSVKTLLILSKEYLSSYWCNLEVDFTHQMSMETRQKLIVPVLKEDCDIPDILKPLTYIDARGDMELWVPRLVAAIESSDDVNNSKLSPYNTDDHIVHEESSRCGCCGRSPFKLRYIPAALDKTVFKLKADMYSNVLYEISESPFFQGRLFCLPSCPLITLLISMSLISVYFLSITISNFNSKEDVIKYNLTVQESVSSSIAINLINSVLYWLVSFVWTVACCIYILKQRKWSRYILIAANRKLMCNNLIVGLNIHYWSATIKVVFMYFNYKSCIDYVESVLRCYNSDCENTEIKTTETTFRTECEERNSTIDEDEFLIQQDRDTEFRHSFLRFAKLPLSRDQVVINNASVLYIPGDRDIDDDDELIIPLLQDDTMKSEDTDANMLRRNAIDILINLSADFIQDFKDEKLEDCEFKRHTTRAMCLCQYAERKNKINRKSLNQYFVV